MFRSRSGGYPAKTGVGVEKTPHTTGGHPYKFNIRISVQLIRLQLLQATLWKQNTCCSDHVKKVKHFRLRKPLPTTHKQSDSCWVRVNMSQTNSNVFSANTKCAAESVKVKNAWFYSYTWLIARVHIYSKTVSWFCNQFITQLLWNQLLKIYGCYPN